MPIIQSRQPLTVLRRPLRAILVALLYDQVIVLRNRDGEYCVLRQVASFTRPELALLYAKTIEHNVLNDATCVETED
jgi:hypothetical protein